MARLSNEQLSDLYPKPKTYEERSAENTERQQRIASQQPQHIYASTSWRLYAIYALAGLVLFVIPDLVMSASIYGVAVSFLFGIVWLWAATQLLQAVLRDLYALALNSASFFALYIVGFTVMLAIMIPFYRPNTTLDILTFLLVASIVHFVVCSAALKFVASRSS